MKLPYRFIELLSFSTVGSPAFSRVAACWLMVVALSAAISPKAGLCAAEKASQSAAHQPGQLTETPAGAEVPSQMAKDLIGTWIQIGTLKKIVEPPAAGGRYKTAWR